MHDLTLFFVAEYAPFIAKKIHYTLLLNLQINN